MIALDALATGVRVAADLSLVRAEESWIPVLFGGLIPVIGAAGVFWLIRWAVKEPPEADEGPEDNEPPPPGMDDDGHEGPLS